MPNSHGFAQRVAAGWPADWQELGVLLAVSGGADSLALLRASAATRTQGDRLAVAHFNHGLRGDESDSDQRFVKELCRRLGIDCLVGAPAQQLVAPRDQAEAASRAARYAFLQHTAEQLGARYVATAHTADDQAETVLHHIIRGTGLSGLAGIPRVRALSPAVSVVRPMLATSRAEVLAYLAEIDQPFRQDRTNEDPRYLRNRIRHELLPLVAKDYAPGIVDSLVRLAALAADAQRVIECQAEALLDRCTVEATPVRVTIDCDVATQADRHVAREMLVALWRRQGWPVGSMGYCEWNTLAGMLQESAGSSSRHILPGAISAEREANLLVLRPSPEPPAPSP